MPSSVKLSVPLEFRRGDLRHDERASVDSGLKLLDFIDHYRSIKGARMLDFGCGIKLAQALVERDTPQALYVGLDVYAKMIGFRSQALADDARFDLRTVDFQNDMYNPAGKQLLPDSTLDVPEGRYDILTMFSVVTHMIPDHTFAILNVLRALAAPDARLVFSAFPVEDQAEDFIDERPENPLLFARYRKAFLEQIVVQSGWSFVDYVLPEKGAVGEHHFYVCAPA